MPRPLWLPYKESWFQTPHDRTTGPFSDDKGGEKVIVRVWRAWLNPARLEAHRHVEEVQYLPMLRRQSGFLGVLFLRRAADRGVSITLWEDGGVVEALKSSPSYQKVTREMIEGGLLAGEPSIEVLEAQTGELRVDALLRVLEVLSRPS